MGYRGKVKEQEEARRLRAENHTILQIAEKLGVSKSSVSLWVRDVPFTPSKRRYGPRQRPNSLHLRKLEEIERLNQEGTRRIGELSQQAFLAAGVALYAGEGSKRDGCVRFSNSDPEMMRFFCHWLRHFFEIDEARLRMRVYLHQGLDLGAAERRWSEVTDVPLEQFGKAYRAVADPTIRVNKHEFGCAYLNYGCARTHRAIMGLVRALLSCASYSGVAQLVAQGIVNPKVAGSSPAPGAAQLRLITADATASAVSRSTS
jgi:hypothetical protein